MSNLIIQSIFNNKHRIHVYKIDSVILQKGCMCQLENISRKYFNILVLFSSSALSLIQYFTLFFRVYLLEVVRSIARFNSLFLCNKNSVKISIYIILMN